MEAVTTMLKRLLTNPTLILTAVLAVSLSNLTPAYGQYGYMPSLGSTSWLYLSRSLFNPGNMLYRGGYGYSAPYYLANSLMWNAAYTASQGINTVAQRNYMNSYRQNQAVDQVSPAKWAYPQLYPQVGAAPPVAPAIPSTGFEMQDDFMPIPGSLPNAAGPPATFSANSPFTNPLVNPSLQPNMSQNPNPESEEQSSKKRKKHKSVKKMPDPAPSFSAPNSQSVNPAATGPIPPGSAPVVTGATAAKPSPFVQAFVDHVNNNFGGDLNKALSDKETKGYARAIGLFNSENDPAPTIPAERSEMIKHIMSDPSEDATTKLNAIRLLLKHGN